MKNSSSTQPDTACATQPVSDNNPRCPVRMSIQVLGGKWKLLLLSYLFEAPRRYGELRRLVPDVTEKMLIQVLRELEADGLLTRTMHHQVPPRVDYALTEAGRQVRPVFDQLLSWGENYLAMSNEQ